LIFNQFARKEIKDDLMIDLLCLTPLFQLAIFQLYIMAISFSGGRSPANSSDFGGSHPENHL